MGGRSSGCRWSTATSWCIGASTSCCGPDDAPTPSRDLRRRSSSRRRSRPTSRPFVNGLLGRIRGRRARGRVAPGHGSRRRRALSAPCATVMLAAPGSCGVSTLGCGPRRRSATPSARRHRRFPTAARAAAALPLRPTSVGVTAAVAGLVAVAAQGVDVVAQPARGQLERPHGLAVARACRGWCAAPSCCRSSRHVSDSGGITGRRPRRTRRPRSSGGRPSFSVLPGAPTERRSSPAHRRSDAEARLSLHDPPASRSRPSQDPRLAAAPRAWSTVLWRHHRLMAWRASLFLAGCLVADLRCDAPRCPGASSARRAGAWHLASSCARCRGERSDSGPAPRSLVPQVHVGTLGSRWRARCAVAGGTCSALKGLPAVSDFVPL